MVQPLSSSQEHRRAGSLFYALCIGSWPHWREWESCYWLRSSQDLTLCVCVPSKIGDTLKTLSALLPGPPCKDFVLLHSQHIFPICIFLWLLISPKIASLSVCICIICICVCIFIVYSISFWKGFCKLIGELQTGQKNFRKLRRNMLLKDIFIFWLWFIWKSLILRRPPNMNGSKSLEGTPYSSGRESWAQEMINAFLLHKFQS